MGGGPVILYEAELHLGEHILVPDTAGWRRERMSALPETAYFEIAADWVCEVLSPSTAQIDGIGKLAVYLKFQAGYCWSADPDACTLEVFALDGASWRLAASFMNADPVTAAPFEVHSIALDILWAP